MSSQPQKRSMSWFTKSFYLVLTACFLVLGVVGLVLPVIPGLVFLFLAVLVLTKVSTRFNALAGGHAWFRQMRRRWHTLQLLKVTDRLKLGFWYCAAATVRGIEAGVSFIDGVIKSRFMSR